MGQLAGQKIFFFWIVGLEFLNGDPALETEFTADSFARFHINLCLQLSFSTILTLFAESECPDTLKRSRYLLYLRSRFGSIRLVTE